MTVDGKTFQSVLLLTQKNPKNSPIDWFTMGFMFAYSMNEKPIEDLFNTINNITTLSRMSVLSIDETNNILLKMINKAISSEKMNHSPVTKNNQPDHYGSAGNWPSGGSNQKTAQSETRTLDTFAPMDLEERDTVSIDGMSYKDDEDRAEKQGLTLDLLGDEDLVEIDLDLEFKTQEDKPKMAGYVKKPVDKIDLSDIHKPVNLKRSRAREEEELSLELIKQLQEEDNKLQKMIEERKKKEEKASNDATCSICLSSLVEEEFLPLEGCIHIFHSDCFKEYLKSQISSRVFPIKCPSNCGKEISEADVTQVLDKDSIEKFYEYSLQKYVLTHGDEVSCCPTPDCTYVFVQGSEGEENVLTCPLCKKTYCLNCRVEYHKGMSCKAYQVSSTKDENDLKFEKFVKGKRFKQCNNCKFWVEKNKGCNHMVCRCGYQFCYKCGGQYGACYCMKGKRR